MAQRQQLHVAIGSTLSMPGDVERNLAQIVAFARRAGDDAAHLLLTPELSACGYGNYPEVIATAEVAGEGPIYQRLADAARSTGVVICAGFVESANDKKYLAHYVIYPDGNFIVQRKHRITPVERPLAPALPGTRGEDGYEWETLGDPQFNVFEVNGVRCALVICADCGIEKLNESLHEKGVQMLLAPTGAGGEISDRVRTDDMKTQAGRDKYLKVLQTVFFPGQGVADCIRWGRGLAAVNLVGYDGRRHAHLGHGMVINPLGEVVALFHGIPNLDRQRPMYAHGVVDVSQRVESQD